MTKPKSITKSQTELRLSRILQFGPCGGAAVRSKLEEDACVMGTLNSIIALQMFTNTINYMQGELSMFSGTCVLGSANGHGELSKTPLHLQVQE